MLNPQYYSQYDRITEPLAIVIIRQWSDENELFEDKKQTFKFHYGNLEELLKDSVSRIYDYILSNQSKFDLSRDFYFKVSRYGATNSIVSGCLHLESYLYSQRG